MHDRSAVSLTMVQLSAFNTPQFQWGRTRLPKRPQPVPPIYQPELAADAIYWAAHHRRRELWVGFPAVKAIIGNALAPWLADRKLMKQGYSGQMDDQSLPEHRPDNLIEAVHEDYGTHGRFDHRAKTRSPQLWLATHRGAVLAGALALGAMVIGRLHAPRRMRGSAR